MPWIPRWERLPVVDLRVVVVTFSWKVKSCDLRSLAGSGASRQEDATLTMTQPHLFLEVTEAVATLDGGMPFFHGQDPLFIM
jgi:hypothetical protein